MGKKLKDYESSPAYNSPELAWIMNRGIIYFTALFLGSILIASIIKGGIDAHERILEPAPVVEEWMTVQAENTMAQNWAENFIKESPGSEYGDWKTTNNFLPRHLVLNDTCRGIESIKFDDALLGTYKGETDSVKVTLQLFGAGQTIKTFEQYAEKMIECGYTETVTPVHGYRAFKYENGFFMTAGDVILGVRTTNEKYVEELFELYDERLITSLRESQCVSLSVEEKDLYRNIYFNPEEYTGYHVETQKINKVSIDNIPNPTNYTVHNIIDNVNEPEGPLPDSFIKLPEPVQQPNIPEKVNKKQEFSELVSYELEDEYGPGCGWEWHNQSVPKVNTEMLKMNQNNVLSAAQERVDEQAKVYVNERMNWATEIMVLLPLIHEWNTYVAEVQEVFEQWETLERERATLKPLWIQYVNNYNDWLTFDERKEEAQEKYDSAVQLCREQEEELNEWLEEYRNSNTVSNIVPNTVTPTPSPDPTVTPNPDPTVTPEPTITPHTPMPNGCLYEPVKPRILDEMKPNEPQPPFIKENVTVPNSWPQPNN